jgi:NHLM bacteriocin system ABC transporter peptidase/ATP-binding protein
VATTIDSRPVRARRRRVRTSTLLQMEATECGAASLGIVLAWYGRYVPLEQLRVDCGVSRDGSRASNIVKAARNYGLSAKGYKKEPADLRNIVLPAIAFWNFDHFLVLEGFSSKWVYLNDPAMGLRRTTQEEFDQSFTGVVLVFERTLEFRKGGSRRGVIRPLAARLRGNGLSFVFLVLATLALLIPNILVPLYSKIFVDSYLVGGMRAWLLPLLTAMVGTALVTGTVTWLQQNMLLKMEMRMSVNSSAQFFWHVLRLPMEFFAQRNSGDIGSRVESNDRVSQMLSGELATNFVGILLIGFYASFLFRYDVLLTFLGIGVAVTNVIVLRLVSRTRVDATLRMMQEQGKLAGIAMDGLHQIETLKSTGSDDFFTRWAGTQARMFNSGQKLAASSLMLEAVPLLLTALNAALIVGIGGFRVMDGVLTVGMLLAFQVLMANFQAPVNRVMALGQRLQEIQGDLNRLDDVLHYQSDLRFDSVAQAFPNISGQLEGEVELENITFGYNRLQAPLIENFSLHIKPGERVALVGGSGSGKSTIAKIVSSLFAPWTGTLRIDGQPSPSIPRLLLNRSLSVVDQDIFLFDGTIRQNLTMWDDSIPEQVVVQAAKDACIHDDIACRPGGYTYKVEEGGRNFSGGQRQRLEIARALVNNPRILVLDEATSALDPITEKIVDDNLRRRGCTCLIVAHRLSAIRDCDEIVVLDRGRVAERGTHAQLIANNGPYRTLMEGI